jgi:hypothetical protein
MADYSNDGFGLNPLPAPVEPEPQVDLLPEDTLELGDAFDLPQASFEDAEEAFDIPPEYRQFVTEPEPLPVPVPPEYQQFVSDSSASPVPPEIQQFISGPDDSRPDTPSPAKVRPSSASPVRIQQLDIIADPKYGDLVTDPQIDAYINNVISEADGRDFSRPQNERYRKEGKGRIQKTAEEIYRNNVLSTGESRPLMEIISELESEKQAGLGMMDPYSPSNLEYGRNLLQEELMSSDLSSEAKSKIYAAFEKRMKELYPDPTTLEGAKERLSAEVFKPETYLADSSSIPMGQTIQGDITKSLSGTSKLPGALLALGVGGAASLSPDRFYTAGEKALKPAENFAYGIPLTTNLLNWRKGGNTPSVSPGELVGQLREGKEPRINEQAIKDAGELSQRGKIIETDEGRVNIPFYSTADVISINNRISDDEDLIKRKIENILFGDDSKPFKIEPERGSFRTKGSIESQMEAHRSNPIFKEMVNRLFNKYSNVNLYEDKLKGELPSEDQSYIELFSPYFPEETISSGISETINKASNLVFNRTLFQEISPVDLESIMTSLDAQGEGYTELRELLSVVPEEEREKVVGLLFGTERFEFIKGAFTGDLSESLSSQRAIFRNLVARFTQHKSEEQISELAKTGQLGKQWEGLDLDPEERELFHRAIPILFSIEQLAKSPEFQDDAVSFYSHLGEGLSSFPHHMHVSLVGALNYMGADVGTKEMKEEAKIKIEDDMAIVLADFAVVGAMAGKLGQRLLLKKSPIEIVEHSFRQLEGPDSIAKAHGETFGPGPKKTVDDIANKPVDPADVVVLDSTLDPVTGVYDVQRAAAPRNTTIHAEVVVNLDQSYVGYRRELAAVDAAMAKVPDSEKATLAVWKAKKTELERLIRVNRDQHEEARILSTEVNVESPQTGSVEKVTKEIVFGNETALETLKKEGFTKEAISGPPENFPRTVDIAGTKVTYSLDRNLSNSDGSKRLASTDRNNNIRLNPVGSLDEFFNYFEGREPGPTSLQKSVVLRNLEDAGWTPEIIRSIITSPKDANRFLILHELDHVTNNDRANYWAQGRDLLTPDKIGIEVRATVNALAKVRMSKIQPTPKPKSFDNDLLTEIYKQFGSNWKEKLGKTYLQKPNIASLKRIAKKAGIKEEVLKAGKEQISRDVPEAMAVAEVETTGLLTPEQSQKLANYMIDSGIDNPDLWGTLFELSLEKPSFRSDTVRLSRFKEQREEAKAKLQQKELEDDIPIWGDTPSQDKWIFDQALKGLVDDGLIVKEKGYLKLKEAEDDIPDFGATSPARNSDRNKEEIAGLSWEDASQFKPFTGSLKGPIGPKGKQTPDSDIYTFSSRVQKRMDDMFGPEGFGPDWYYDASEHILAARKSKEAFSKSTSIRSGMPPDQVRRIEYNASRIARRLDLFDDLTKGSKEHTDAVIAATKRLEEIASRSGGYRIGNYTKDLKGLNKMIRALRDMEIKDIVVWKTLFNRSTLSQVSNKVVATYIAEVEELQYLKGTQAREQAIQQIDPYGPQVKDGPMRILSKETRENPRIINDKLDSLTIAEELARSGDTNPASYFGMNLTAQEQSGFIDLAQKSNEKVAIIARRKNELTGTRFEESGLFGEDFNRGGLSGIKVEVDPLTHSITPRKIKGIEDVPLRTRARRIAGRVILGDKGYNFANQNRSGQNPVFSALAATEAMVRFYAVANIPKWYRLGVAEMVLHARAKGWKGWQGNMARQVFEGLAKPSYTLGDEMYYAIKSSEGDFSLDVRKLDNKFSEPLDKFIVTDAKIKEVFGEMQSLKGKDITLDRNEIHQLGHIVHRNVKDVKIVDKRSLEGSGPPKVYNLSEIIEPVVDAGNLRSVEYAAVNKKIKRLLKITESRELTELESYRVDRLIERSNDLRKHLVGDEKWKHIVPTDSVFPKMSALKEAFSQAKSRNDGFEAAALKDQIEIYSEFTPSVVSRNVGSMRYRLKKPASKMDDFEKSLVVFADQAIKPRANYIFDLVVQLLVGENTVKLMFDSGKGFQNIVAKKSIGPTGLTVYEVVKEFEPTINGQLGATAFIEALNPPPGKLDLSTSKTPKTGDLTDPNFALSEISSREAIKSIGKYVTITKDTLSQSLSPSPRAPRKGREISMPGTDLIERSMNWLSTFYETNKLQGLVEDMLLAAKEQNIGDEALQGQFKRLARAVLSGVDGGRLLIKKHGGDEARAMNELLSMSPKQVEKAFGSALRENERFFIKTAYKENFNSAHFLSLLSDYNTTFFKTSTELLNNTHQLKLANKFRSEGKLLTESEWLSLPRGMRKQWVQADQVLSKPGDSPVFSRTLSGSRVHVNIAEHFSRQVGLQKAQDLSLTENARPIKKFLNSVSQYSKVNLLLDVINNTVLRNKLAAALVQSVSHADFVMNPSYLTRSIKLIRGVENGTIDPSSLPPKFVEAMKVYTSGSTSLKAEFYKTKQGRLWRDLVLDAGDYAAQQNLSGLINAVDSPDSIQAIENLAKVLSLKGFDQNITGFFEALRTQDIDAVAPEFMGSKNIGAVLEKIGVAREKFLNFYSSVDGFYKTAYHWYLLESKGMSPALAFKESNKTYVDYGDMSPLINFFRFGGGHVGYSSLSQEFIGFAANQVPNHWDLITNKPVRSWMLAHLSEAYDRAVDETIKFAFTTEELRHLFRDPTLRMTTIRPEAEATTGLERGTDVSQRGGLPYSYSGEAMTGVPAAPPGLPGLPLLPVSARSLHFGTPLKNEHLTSDDIPRVVANVSRIFGAMWNSVAESTAQRSSAKKMEAKIDLDLAEKYETFDGRPRQSVGNAALKALYRRMYPRIFQSAAQLTSGLLERPVLGGVFQEMKSKSSAIGSLLAFSGKQIDLNTLLESDIVPKQHLSRLKKTADKWEASITVDSPQGDIDEATRVVDELDALELEIQSNQDRLKEAQLEALEDIRLAVFAKMLKGKLTLKELSEVFAEIDEQE